MRRAKSILAVAAIVAFADSPAATAADVRVKAPPPAAPVWSWAGFYLGGHVGAAFGWKDWQTADGILVGLQPFHAAATIGGKIAGSQIGYNWQAGSTVWGVELSGSLADVYGDAKCAVALFLCHTEVDWFGTATARIGFTNDHLLLYVKGGGAVRHDNYRMTSFAFTNVFNGDQTRWGGVVGAGLEYAFTSRWSAFVDYNYMLFGHETARFTDGFGGASNIRIGQDLHLLKLGVNYRLGATSQAAASRPIVYAPMVGVAEWEMEVGARYWYSRGTLKKDLFDPFVMTQLNSRLTYGPSTGHSWEAFARFDHNSGVFVKGNLGIGALLNGTLRDDDFLPGHILFSATHSTMKDGKLRYGALDVGYAVLGGPTWKVGPFVGYRYFFDSVNGYGCRQIVASGICVPTIPDAFLGATETETWRGMAVGANGHVMLNERAKLSVDAAYLPYVDRAGGFDNHWLRADINPLIEPGHGWGAQVEAMLSYAVTSRLSLGIGGRYWHFETTGAYTQFPGIGPLSPMKFWSDRYGGFLQATYKAGPEDLPFEKVPIGGRVTKSPPESVDANWMGFYLGAHVGGGWGRKEWNSATGLLNTGANFPGEGDIDGLLGGGQLGFNYQTGNWVLGVEIDGGWTDYYGNTKCGQFVGTIVSYTCNTQINSLGTVTARIGQTYGNVLLYAKAGGAWANESYDARSLTTGLIFTGDQTRLGWTFGYGIELAILPNWSVKAEYNYLWFGDENVTLTNQSGAQSVVNIEQRLQLVKIGANYRFNAGTVAAKSLD